MFWSISGEDITMKDQTLVLEDTYGCSFLILAEYFTNMNSMLALPIDWIPGSRILKSIMSVTLLIYTHEECIRFSYLCSLNDFMSEWSLPLCVQMKALPARARCVRPTGAAVCLTVKVCSCPGTWGPPTWSCPLSTTSLWVATSAAWWAVEIRIEAAVFEMKVYMIDDGSVWVSFSDPASPVKNCTCVFVLKSSCKKSV